jgi:hypothetical protein
MNIAWIAPSSGWIISKLQGKDAFSDGSAMFVGKPKGKTRKLPKKDAFDSALKKCLAKRLDVAETNRNVIAATPLFPAFVEFRNGTRVQAKYYCHAMKFVGVKFFFGKTYDEENRAVICKVRDKIVGVIMPIRKAR